MISTVEFHPLCISFSINTIGMQKVSECKRTIPKPKYDFGLTKTVKKINAIKIYVIKK